MISLKRFFSWPDFASSEAASDHAEAAPLDEQLHFGGGGDDLSSALLQALHMLVEGLPLDSGDPAQEDSNSRRAGLLRRLEGELLPFDVLEIASDALMALEEHPGAIESGGQLEEHTLQANDSQAELARAALQALKTVVEGLPVSGGEADRGGNPAIAELLRRLDGPLVPFDLLEIAGDALTVVEREGVTRQDQRRGEEDRREFAEQQAQLVKASLRALQTVLETLAVCDSEFDTRAKRVMPELVRRIESVSAPADVLAIANETVMVLDHDADAARGRQTAEKNERRLSAEQVEMANALRQGLQMLLAGLPLPSAAAGMPQASSRRAMDELRRRLDRPLSPAEVLEIASESLETLSRDSETTQDRYGEQEQQRRWAESQVALSNALLDSLQMLLSGLAELTAEAGEPHVAANNAINGLLRRLEGPLTPAEVPSIAQEALISIRQDLKAAKDRDRPQDGQQREDRSEDLAKTLLQALQILLGNWPTPSGGAGEERKRVLDDLLRRLQEPLVPFDILEIASDALTALEQEAKAAAESHQKDGQEIATRQSDQLSAYLQALRTLIAGLPAWADVGVAFDARGGSSMTRLLRRLENPPAPVEVLDIAKEALATAREDHKAILNRFHLEGRERQAMISMLTDTVATLSAWKTSSIAWLRQIEQRIARASTLEELRMSRSTLGDCLQAIRQTSPASRRKTAEGVYAFERRTQAATGRPVPALKVHSESTENTDGSAPPQVSAEYAVVFVLDREEAIASRFGESVRHHALRFVQQHLKNGLMPSDRLVRWKGAAFVASIKRVGPLPEVRAELTSLGCISVPPLVDVGSRSIRLPISLSWAVFPHARFASVDVLFEKVDDFLARTQPLKPK